MTIKEVKRLAEKIRKTTEIYSINNDYPLDDDLCGFCAVSSLALAKEMRKLGLRPSIMLDGYHCWLEWKGYIIDLTATQFGFGNKLEIPKVFICPAKNKKQAHYNYKNGRRVKVSYKWPNWIKNCATSPMSYDKLLRVERVE